MPIIIAGTIDFEPDRAARIVENARPFIEASLREDGCLHLRLEPRPHDPRSGPRVRGVDHPGSP